MTHPSLFMSKGGTNWMIKLNGCKHVPCVSALGDCVCEAFGAECFTFCVFISTPNKCLNVFGENLP